MYGYIYMTINILNGKRYIGKKVSDKFLSSYKGSGTILGRAIRKYGIDNFAVELVESISTNGRDLANRERYWIDYYNATDDPMFYNIHEGGFGGNTTEGYSREKRIALLGANRGRKMSEEQKRKISESCKMTINKESVKQKIINTHLGRKRLESTCKKISDKLIGNKNSKGVVRTQQEKDCVSANQKGRMYVHLGDIEKKILKEEFEYYSSIGYMKGRSDKARLKISMSHRKDKSSSTIES